MSDKDTQAVFAKLEHLEAIAMLGAKNVLGLDEAAMLTGYSKGHLYRLTSSRAVPHYKKGNTLFFDKAELEEWLKEHRVPTAKETDQLADNYLLTH